MAAGCVPCALGSFAAVHDVLGAGGGVVVPAPYDEGSFAEAVAALMRDGGRLAAAARARSVAAAFTVARVVDRWWALFEEL